MKPSFLLACPLLWKHDLNLYCIFIFNNFQLILLRPTTLPLLKPSLSSPETHVVLSISLGFLLI
jgi:hypothetical protein